jgi:hypothetical protein
MLCETIIELFIYGYFAICVGGLFFCHLMMSPYVVV